MSLSRPLGLLLAGFILLGVIYSAITPLFEAPDEQWHFAFVQNVAQGRGLPEQSLPLQHLARQEGSQPPLYYLLAAALTFWIDTSDYSATVRENPHYGFDVPGVVNDNKNLFIHTAQEKFPYHNTALAMHMARWLSLAMGAVAVLFTYRLTRLVAPHNENAALAAAALVAFTPQFLFISSAVSNDSAIVALCAVALYLLVRALRVAPTWRDAVLIGIAAGLCAITKVSGLAMLALAMLALIYINRANLRQLITQAAVALAAFAIVAGWWYGRNLALYGEVTGTRRMVEIFGGRVAPLTFEGWGAQLREVFETFWVGFGWGNIRAPEWVYWVVGLGALLGIVGLLIGFWRVVKRSRTATPRIPPVRSFQVYAPLFVLAAWALIIFLALLQWMVQTQAPHGRLMFPALPALAPLAVVGWMQLVPRAAQKRVSQAIAVGLFGFAAVAAFMLLLPAYAYPTRLDENDVASIPSRVDIRFDDSLMLLGSSVRPHPVDPRGALQVDLYWRVLKPMNTDYSLNLAALDENYRVVGSRNSYPGQGMLPTSLMTAGEIWRDTYWLPATAPTGLVQVSVYELKSQQNLDAFDPAGNEITPIVNRFAFPR